MITVQTAILRCAQNLDIPFVMYAEEGETEYGGSSKLKESPTYDVEDSINLYLSGVDPKKYIGRFSRHALLVYIQVQMS